LQGARAARPCLVLALLRLRYSRGRCQCCSACERCCARMRELYSSCGAALDAHDGSHVEAGCCLHRLQLPQCSPAAIQHAVQPVEHRQCSRWLNTSSCSQVSCTLRASKGLECLTGTRVCGCGVALSVGRAFWLQSHILPTQLVGLHTDRHCCCVLCCVFCMQWSQWHPKKL
jgi:hypothetical protein